MSDSPTAGGKPVSPYLEIGATVGHYRIESFVAHGGMAFVYEATDLRLGRHVALKLLAAPPTRESDFRERFTRESRYAASLDHPNIVPIYEAGEADGLLFIAMRFVSGVNLDSRLREVHRLDGPGALAVLAPIADALDLAHSAGLVHRDVKPADILLTDTGRGHEHVYLNFVDVASGAVIGTAPVGTHPQDVEYSADGAYVYTADVDGNSVSVVDKATREVRASIPTTSPTSIAVTPDGRRAYVTNLEAGTLTVLNTAG